MTDPDIKHLDALLAEVATQQPEIPDTLMNAVLRDAALARPRVTAGAQPASLWERLMDAIGGWPALGSLTAAGVAGVWLGVSPPVAFESAAASLIGTVETVDLFGSDIVAVFDVEGGQ